MSRKKPITVFKDGQQTTRAKLDDLAFKSDSFRKKYDLRYADSDRVNNIFVRGYITKLKKATDDRKNEQLRNMIFATFLERD